MDEGPSDQSHKEIIAIFQDRVTNIRDLKRYQWQAAYYAVALMGALVAIAHWSESSLGLRLLLVIGCGITAWLWQVIDASLREGLERQREDQQIPGQSRTPASAGSERCALRHHEPRECSRQQRATLASRLQAARPARNAQFHPLR